MACPPTVFTLFYVCGNILLALKKLAAWLRNSYVSTPLFLISLNRRVFYCVVAVSHFWAIESVFAAPYTPASDNEIVTRLPVRLTTDDISVTNRKRFAKNDPELVAGQAQALITQSREQADPRLLGRAQSLLQPWWNRPEAPPSIAVLQATILQSNHQFEEARNLLQAVIAQNKTKASTASDLAILTQAWLTLATINRVTGKLADSLHACAQVSALMPSVRLYGAACTAETQSLQGQHQVASRVFIVGANSPGISLSTRAWLLSLAGENEERAGQDNAAKVLYLQAQDTNPDRYTALALADLLLRLRLPQEALTALKQELESDGVLIRRAMAYKYLNDSRWQELSQILEQRFADQSKRSGAAQLHAREIALYQLHVRNDANAALVAAQNNLRVQREPLDFLLLLQSAQATKNKKAWGEAQQQVLASGIKDARFQSVLQIVNPL